MVERFQDALLTAELDPGLFRRQGELPEKKEARIQQFLSVLERAIGAERPAPRRSNGPRSAISIPKAFLRAIPIRAA